jgi:hypothetical protein
MPPAAGCVFTTLGYVCRRVRKTYVAPQCHSPGFVLDPDTGQWFNKETGQYYEHATGLYYTIKYFSNKRCCLLLTHHETNFNTTPLHRPMPPSTENALLTHTETASATSSIRFKASTARVPPSATLEDRLPRVPLTQRACPIQTHTHLMRLVNLQTPRLLWRFQSPRRKAR